MSEGDDSQCRCGMAKPSRFNVCHQCSQELEAKVEALDVRVDTLETGLDRIITWSEAYPLDIFPEPDFKKVREALKVADIKIDAVSASNMRRVVVGVGKIARLARKAPPQ